MNEHQECLDYLKAASPELREALVHIAEGLSDALIDPAAPSSPAITGDHIACKAVLYLCENPRQALLAILNGSAPKKRGRPRGSKAKEGAK